MARARIYDIVGESQINRDGSSRQIVLRHCDPGDPVKLVREPRNAYDPNAVLVTTLSNRGIGYIKRSDAPELATRLDAREPYSAQIQKIKGGMEDYPSYGVMVSVAFAGETHPEPEPLDDEQLSFREEYEDSPASYSEYGSSTIPFDLSSAVKIAAILLGATLLYNLF